MGFVFPRVYAKRFFFLLEDIYRFFIRKIEKFVRRFYHRSGLSDEEMQFPDTPPTGKY